MKPSHHGGRKLGVSKRTLRALRREAEKDGVRPKLVICKSVGINASDKTMTKYLHLAGLSYSDRTRMLYLSKKQAENRQKWCRDHKTCELEFWRKVVWTDETMIVLPSGKNNKKAWIDSNSKRRMPNLKVEDKQSTPKVMFWGCFSVDGPGPLLAVDEVLDAKGYVELLREHVLPYIRILGGPVIFQQDNAPIHKARIAMEFFRENGIELLEWPPNSPDLSPIENLWSLLKHRLSETSPIPANKADLKTTVLAIWNSLQPNECSNLALHLPQRIKKCLANKGGRIGIIYFSRVLYFTMHSNIGNIDLGLIRSF